MEGTGTSRWRIGSAAAILSAVASVVVMLLLSACAAPPSTSEKAASTKPPMMSGTSAATVQTCAECGGKGAAPKVDGAAKMENGVQTIEIRVANGYYAPNTISAKAGVPTKVVFIGSVKGCLAKPMFASLGKKADFSSGSASLDLGSLPAGTYRFTCGMGRNAGTITLH
jgi:hypothetical protein